MDYTDEALSKKSIQIHRFGVALSNNNYCFTLKHDKNHHGVNPNVLDIVQQTFGKEFWFPPAVNRRSILKRDKLN